MKAISILDKAGAFAENKDVARDIRLRTILPALENDLAAIQVDHYGDCEAGRVATVPGVAVIPKLRVLL